MKDYKMELLAKTKKEVISIMGDGLNYYHLDTWIYLLDHKWWGMKKKMYIYFDESNHVSSIKIKSEYF